MMIIMETCGGRKAGRQRTLLNSIVSTNLLAQSRSSYINIDQDDEIENHVDADENEHGVDLKWVKLVKCHGKCPLHNNFFYGLP